MNNNSNNMFAEVDTPADAAPCSSLLGAGSGSPSLDSSSSAPDSLECAAGQPSTNNIHKTPTLDEQEAERYFDFIFASARRRSRARDAAFEPRESLEFVWNAGTPEDPAAAAQTYEARVQELSDAGFTWSKGLDDVDITSESASHEHTTTSPDKYRLAFDGEQSLMKTDNLSLEVQF